MSAWSRATLRLAGSWDSTTSLPRSPTSPVHTFGPLTHTHSSMEFIVLYAAVVIHAPRVLRLYFPPSCSVRELAKIRVNTKSMLWLVLLKAGEEDGRVGRRSRRIKEELGRWKFQPFAVTCVNNFIHRTKLFNINVQFPEDFNIANKQLVQLFTWLKLINKSINIKNLRPVTSW